MQAVGTVVRIDTKGRALEHVVRVSKSGSDNVMWVALGNGGPWTISFGKTGPVPEGGVARAAGSPFQNASYQVPQGGSVSTTGGPKASATAGQTYSYNILNATGQITEDPDVDIDP